MIGQYRYFDKTMIEQDKYFEERLDISGANGYSSYEGLE